jgi:hypothetical protein
MRKVLLSSLLLALACSDDGSSSSSTPTSFCENWAEAACSPETVSACQAPDVAECRASQVAFCVGLIPTTGFSGAQADQCLDAVGRAYSDADLSASELKTVLRLGAPCDRLVRGPQEEGEVCSARSECNTPDGFDCVFKDDDLTGTCQPPKIVGPGLDCTDQDAVCQEGFYCNGSNCIAGKAAGAACVTHRECGSTGFCGSASICEDRLTVDAACSSDEQCLDGLCYQFTTERVCADRVRLSRDEPICVNLR